MYSDDVVAEKCIKFSQHARLCKPLYNNHNHSKKSLFTVGKLLELLATTIITYQFETILDFIINTIVIIFN